MLERLTWKCHICGKERPDDKISVRTIDRSIEFGLPFGSFQENIRYCNDNAECVEGSKTFRFLKKKESMIFHKLLQDYPLNNWMEAADGCEFCGAKYQVRIIFVDKDSACGDIEWKISHKEDCSEIEEESEGSDIAGWTFQGSIHSLAGRTYLPLRSRANIGPCLECGKLVVGVPLILFIDDGRGGQLDFCFQCAEKLGILKQLVKA